MIELPLASMRRHRPDAARYSLRPGDTHGQIMDRELTASRGWDINSIPLAVVSKSAHGCGHGDKSDHSDC
ncbi:hypothetical protein AB4305_21350 [Nocardia sp. 2YAB30]|uniref:hypothetical protein n=1 Tax=unclassified Nocardia TaxID=2637762 RepID=UPI003F9897DC